MTKAKTNNDPVVVTLMVWLMRLVVGGVFVFSGFVKAIDPWGSYYKFNEYLLTLGWDNLLGQSLFAAFAVPIVELTLGLLLLIGAYRRMAPLLLLLLMLVMTPLTLWLALTDAVPDCGCFGDALVLSNWATFGKNVALTAGLVFLLLLNKRVKGLYGPAVQWLVTAATGVFAFALAYYGYFTQPLMDFRPYRVGTALSASSAGATNEDDYLFIYSKDGVEQEFTIDSLPDEEDGWTFVNRRPVSRGVAPVSNKISHQLVVMDDGVDVGDEVLASGNRLMLFLFPDVQDVNIAHTFMINELDDYAHAHDAAVYGICSATSKQIEEWKDISMADYPMLTADDSDLKMMARGNPAVVYIEDGIIKWKRTLGSISDNRLHDAKVTLATLSDDFNPSAILRSLCISFSLVMLVLLVFNRTHVVIRELFFNKPAKEKKDESSEDNRNVEDE